MEAKEQKQPTHAILEIDLFDKLTKYITSKPWSEVDGLVGEIRQRTKFADMSEQPEPKEQPDKAKPRPKPKQTKNEKD